MWRVDDRRVVRLLAMMASSRRLRSSCGSRAMSSPSCSSRSKAKNTSGCLAIQRDLEQGEIARALFVDRTNLAVDQQRTLGETGERRGDEAEPVGPVVTAAGVEPAPDRQQWPPGSDSRRTSSRTASRRRRARGPIASLAGRAEGGKLRVDSESGREGRFRRLVRARGSDITILVLTIQLDGRVNSYQGAIVAPPISV